jgi:hypothetical protein
VLSIISNTYRWYKREVKFLITRFVEEATLPRVTLTLLFLYLRDQ